MSVSSLTLFRRAAILCFIISITLFLLPNSSVSKGSAASFGVIIDNTEPIKMDTWSSRTDSIQAIGERLKQRQRNLENRCSKENKVAKSTPATLLYSRHLSMVYCPVHSAASTQIKHTMLLNENQKIKNSTNISLRQRVDSQARRLNLPVKMRQNPLKLQTIHNLAAVLVTRNPWMILLTVYLTEKKEFINPCLSFTNTKTKELEFEGFLQCIVNRTKKDTKMNILDVRLSPVTYTCAACSVPYNAIVHYESLYEELAAIPWKAGRLLVEKTKKSVAGDQISISETDYQRYVSSLQRHTIDSVQQLYREDFLYFGYDML